MAEGTKGGRVALVTGSTAGIGRAVALSMAREGCNVILNGRREESRVIELKARIDELRGAPGSCDYVRWMRPFSLQSRSQGRSLSSRSFMFQLRAADKNGLQIVR